MKKTIWFVIIALIIGIIIYYLNKGSKTEYFNEVTLPETNTVYNSSNYNFMDTIVSIGLRELNVKDKTVTIRNMPSYVSSSFDNQNNMQLEASVYGVGDTYIIYVTDMDRNEAMKILSHELIHLEQYASKRLVVVSNGLVTWEGKEITILNYPYNQRPWEIEAYDGQRDLQKRIEKILYQ
jgi:hypothetical protein